MTEDAGAAVASIEQEPPQPAVQARPGPGGLWAFWQQGGRTAYLMRPAWPATPVGAPAIAFFFLLALGVAVATERLNINGEATFFWPGLLNGWLPMLVCAWLCFALVRESEGAGAGVRAPSAAALLVVMTAQVALIDAVLGLLLAPIARGDETYQLTVAGWSFGLGWIRTAWLAVAQSLLLWRAGAASRRAKGLAVLLLLAVLGAVQADDHWRYWEPAEPPVVDEATDDAPADRFSFSQETLELQPQLLAERLGALKPQRKRAIDVYVITFAPYAEADVFRRESGMVAGVMQQRFDAEGRVIQLVNHRDAAREWPWATPLNLRRAIDRVAELMDREQDVLFIHMTSHGAQSGELAASFWPLEVDPVTPQDLKAWLDEAGIRHRILSISACYSGSWIAPLSEPDALVMTAADADHTSYGCGRRSDLTFFGRAMYDEQMRQTLSFEAAHAQARQVIDQREKEAGKTDGYSNPQIAMGERMREHLARLETQLKSTPHAR